MKRIRGGGGLGDAIYVRSVVSYLLTQGAKLEVCTKFPEVYHDLPVRTAEHSRDRIDIVAHYMSRKREKTNQWQDICICAGIPPDTPQNIDWPDRQTPLMDRVTGAAQGKKILLVAAPHAPLGRADKFGWEILPDRAKFAATLGMLNEYCRVLIGGGLPLYEVPHDLNLSTQTRVTDLFDLAKASSAMVGQCSFVIPLAESFHKPLLCVWSSKVATSKDDYVRRVLPEKILSDPKSLHVYDDWSIEKITEVVNAFRKLG